MGDADLLTRYEQNKTEVRYLLEGGGALPLCHSLASEYFLKVLREIPCICSISDQGKD
jgi:hypothetical protein